MRSVDWKMRQCKNGSFKLVDGKKLILVHRMMDLYWIDYLIEGRHAIATLSPAKTLAEAWKRVGDAKREFVLEPER